MTQKRGVPTLIDFHAHILPGIDDGSRDVPMTAAMLREEMRQGVELVTATPHFYANRMSVGAFLDRRAEALKKTERLHQETDDPLPAVAVGAEVYYFPGMGNAKDISRLCVEKTRTILVEMPFEQWNEEMLRDIETLIEKQKLTVALAHVERYVGFQKDRRVWNRLLSLPLIPQINAGSFLKPGGLFRWDRKRKFCLNFLEEYPNVIVGSDCHNMENRAPNLILARKEIETALGSEALSHIDRAARQALELRSL